MSYTSITHVRVYVYKSLDNFLKYSIFETDRLSMHSRRFVGSLKEQTELIKMCKKLIFKIFKI
jgi:hypothetical protein